MKISSQDIEIAAERIRPFVIRPPLVHAPVFAQRFGTGLYIKPETLQETGSFKFRGATNAILQLSSEARERGVVTASSGNHGPALSRAAQKLGVKCTVCLSEMVPVNKVENVHRNGGIVHITGRDYDESVVEAIRLAEADGLTLIPAFDHPHIVAGAGTVGLEIVKDIPDIDTILVPLSGGGLLAGTAIAVKAVSKKVKVIGVSMERGASMHRSLEAGQPVNITEEESLADALGGNIGLDNRWTFDPILKLVDETILVSEEAIADAMHEFLLHQGLVVEGAGAVGLAALLSGQVTSPGASTVIIASGRNVDVKRIFEKLRTNVKTVIYQV